MSKTSTKTPPKNTNAKVKKMPVKPKIPTGVKAITQPGPPKPTQKAIDHFEASMEGIKEIGDAVNQLVGNKYSRQALIMAINDNIKPIYKD